MSRKPRIALAIVLLLAVAAVAAWWLWPREEEETTLTASGTVEATDAVLGFQVPGTLATVGPHEGDEVAAGDPIAALSTREMDARVEQAAAQVAAAEARLRQLRAGSRSEEVAQARARTTAARQRLADAERDFERTRTLHAGGAVPQEALDKAQLARELAAADAEQAGEQQSLVQRGPRQEEIDAAAAEVATARAARAAAEAQRADAILTAPRAGVVEVRHREPGEVVGAGTPVVTLQDLDDRWVRIYVPEDRIGAVGLGAAASIRSDTFPERTYPGARGLPRQRGGVHAGERADAGGAGAPGLCRQGEDHRRSAARAQARHAGGRRDRAAAAGRDGGADGTAEAG